MLFLNLSNILLLQKQKKHLERRNTVHNVEMKITDKNANIKKIFCYIGDGRNSFYEKTTDGLNELYEDGDNVEISLETRLTFKLNDELIITDATQQDNAKNTFTTKDGKAKSIHIKNIGDYFHYE